MISITTAKKLITCHRLYCGDYWGYETGLFDDPGTFISFEEVNQNPVLYNTRSSARQFVRWLKDKFDIIIPSEIVLNNKDEDSLLKKLSESITTDEVTLLTQLCSLYEKMAASLPALTMEETLSNLEYKLQDLFEDTKTDTCRSLPDQLKRELNRQEIQYTEEAKLLQTTAPELPCTIGTTAKGKEFTFDLAKAPHLLIAGMPGQGKMTVLNAIITSLLLRKRPEELKLILIDPKRVEFNIYDKKNTPNIPENIENIITEPEDILQKLNDLCILMDDRYELLRLTQTRNIKEYNKQLADNPSNGHEPLPYIVTIIDEYADLIMIYGREIESPIARIAQFARAVGIHLIITTQRPAQNIITGLIKANFPYRIAFKCYSAQASKTIIDHPAAVKLAGPGDALFLTPEGIIHLQCALVDEDEAIRRLNTLTPDKKE